MGSVAFAWNISTALGGPVAAIVPGYGVADAVEQALGGWFGFGLHGWIVKEMTQSALAYSAPQIAHIGRGLMMTVRNHKKAETGAPLFDHGSGSADVLYAILDQWSGVPRLYGHSKGALVIERVVSDLPREKTNHLSIVTFGCPISKGASRAAYRQFLGWFDGLGLLNSWGNIPDKRLVSTHTTNSRFVLSMDVASLAKL